MVIRVSEIPEEGLAIEGVEGFEHPFHDPAWTLEAVSLFVERDKEDVLARGYLRARVPQMCSRCLEPFVFVPAAHVDARYCPGPKSRDEKVELTPGELEVDFYADDLLDVSRLIQTETELGLPMKPLCRADCRGLCPVCGGNRNLVPCVCEVPLPDPRLAALKDLAARLSSR
jgi:uncharacterized protein